jgi:hypothetical protein
MERAAYRNQFIDTVLWMVQLGRMVARRGACKPVQVLPSRLRPRPRTVFSSEYLGVVATWAPSRCDDSEMVASRLKSTPDVSMAQFP